MKLFEKEITDPASLEGFQKRVTLHSGEALLLYRDSSFRNTGSSGIVVTSQRIIQYEGKGGIEAAWSEVESTKYLDKFPKRLVLMLKTRKKKEIVLVGIEAAEAEAIVSAADAARGGGSSLPAKGVGPAAPEESQIVVDTNTVAGRYKLYHGAQVDREGDIRDFLFTLLIVPVVIAMWFASGVNHPIAIIFKISFWIGIVAIPVMLVSGIRDLMKKGPRKIVYGINEHNIIKKVLRGENDPLWKAETAPADTEALGLGDKQWKFKEVKLSFSVDQVFIKTASQKNWVGTRTPELLDKIPRTDFADGKAFDQLLNDLQARIS